MQSKETCHGKGGRSWLMMLCCIVAMAGLFAFARGTGSGSRFLSLGFMLLCPLGHLLMMKMLVKSGDKKQ